MSKQMKIALGLFVATLSLFAVGAVNESWNMFQLNVRKPATFGGYGQGTPSKLGQITVQTDNAATKGLVIKGSTSQTANLLELQNAAGTTVMTVDSAGGLTATSGTGDSVTDYVPIDGGTFSGDVVFDGNLDITNQDSYIQLPNVISNPCSSATDKGKIFWSATGNYLCVCNQAGSAVQVSDGTSACTIGVG